MAMTASSAEQPFSAAGAGSPARIAVGQAPDQHKLIPEPLLHVVQGEQITWGYRVIAVCRVGDPRAKPAGQSAELNESNRHLSLCELLVVSGDSPDGGDRLGAVDDPQAPEDERYPKSVVQRPIPVFA
jgi:hypothetical protein